MAVKPSKSYFIQPQTCTRNFTSKRLGLISDILAASNVCSSYLGAMTVKNEVQLQPLPKTVPYPVQSVLEPERRTVGVGPRESSKIVLPNKVHELRRQEVNPVASRTMISASDMTKNAKVFLPPRNSHQISYM